MSQSKFLILRKAIVNVASEKEFCNRWVSQSSLLKAMNAAYSFHSNITVRAVTLGISKISPSCDSVEFKNHSGIYRCKKNHKSYLFFQENTIPPPLIPCFFTESDEWEKIMKEDEEKCSLYILRKEKEEERQNRTKRRKLDKVKISLNIEHQVKVRKETIIFDSKKFNNQPFVNYWNSPECSKLFHPIIEKQSFPMLKSGVVN